MSISPLGLRVALELAAAGATKGSVCAAEFASVLGHAFSDLSGSASSTSTDPAVTLRLAAAAWIGADVRPEYASAAAKAGVHVASMPDDATEINSWVQTATQGEINSVIDSIVPGAVASLVSAVYFQGRWKVPFSTESTEDDFFYVNGEHDQHRVQCKMMCMTDCKFGYAEVKTPAGSNVRALEMDYGEQGLYSAIAVLPEEGVSVSDLVKALGDEKSGVKLWLSIVDNLTEPELETVALPRFKVDSSTKMNDVLKSMGLDKAFDGDFENGAFDRMTPEAATKIAEVVHRATVDVSEEGTVAASATAVILARSLKMSDKKFIRFDRPFLFVIREKKTGEIVFFARVDNPSGTIMT